MKKHEIEAEIGNKGEFIQINELVELLKEELPLDIKKFVIQKLAFIYESRKMFNDCAVMYELLSKNSIAFSEQIKQLMKAVKFYIKAGIFDKAEYSMKKALAEANSMEKEDIYFTVKDLYKKQAEEYEDELKRAHAARIYEKILEMNILDSERLEIKERLIDLYEKLGRLQEYYKIKRSLS